MNYVVYGPKQAASEWNRGPVEAACAFCGSFDWYPAQEHVDCFVRKDRMGGLGTHRRLTDGAEITHFWCSYCGQQWIA